MVSTKRNLALRGPSESGTVIGNGNDTDTNNGREGGTRAGRVRGKGGRSVSIAQ